MIIGPIMSFSHNEKWVHGYAVQSERLPVRMVSLGTGASASGEQLLLMC